jgi:neutral ceramidase
MRLLKAGWSRIAITPEIGTRLTGFSAREGVSTGVHDDLYVRSLVIESEARSVALVSVEVLALDGDFITAVKQGISRRTDIPAARILIACTHTHSGPVTIKTFFNPEETVEDAYMARLAAAIEQSAVEAWERRAPALAGWGVARVTGVGVNRRDPEHGYVDEDAGILKISGAEGAARAVVIHYACHPTVLGPNNLLVTGDFPSFALEEVERATGAFAMFFNGAQGDVSMGHSSELSAIGIIAPGRTFERAAEMGARLAEAVLAELPRIHTGDVALDAGSVALDLPLKSYPPTEELSREARIAGEHLASLAGRGADDVELRQAKMQALYTSIERVLAGANSEYPSGTMPLELQGVRIGGTLLVGLPAEAFAEVGQSMKRASGSKILVVGLANGYIGYVPCRPAYAEGGYEIVSSRTTPEAEDALAAAAARLACELFQER